MAWETVLGARLHRYHGLGSLSATKSTAIGFYAAHNAFSLTEANEQRKKKKKNNNNNHSSPDAGTKRSE